MPSLENLRKQAKQILRWHRDRHYTVAYQIRSVLPRFRHLDDAGVLAAAFKLADAQEMVARQHGFESWEALKQGIASMTNTNDTTIGAAKLLSAESQLFVTDIKRACNFFTGKLGFRIAFLYGEPPFYGQVSRDGASLNLRHVDACPFDQAMRRREEWLSASITVDDVKKLYLEFQAAGVEFFQQLRTEPWGARTFIVADPDGNLVLFA